MNATLVGSLLHPSKSDDKDVQLARVSFKINDFLQNPDFSNAWTLKIGEGSGPW